MSTDERNDPQDASLAGTPDDRRYDVLIVKDADD